MIAILPALVGSLTWNWLQEVTGGYQPYGIHPMWIYLWHPPLMDVLFGLLVLAGFIQKRRRWWLFAASLVLLSILVHSVAVACVVNTQWLLDPLVDMRFASVLPVTVVATIVLTTTTAALAKLAPRRLFLYSCIAGFIAGFVFLVVLETDTGANSWFWRNNIQWILWHASIATALHFGNASIEHPLKYST